MSSIARRTLFLVLCFTLALFGLTGLAAAETAPSVDAPNAEAPAVDAPAEVAAAEAPAESPSCDSEEGLDLGLESPLDTIETTPTTCTATAYCSSGSVSCTGCPANRQHASCPGERGWVSCGGQVTYCPACPPSGGSCNPPCKFVCAPTGGQCNSNGTCDCY